MIRVLDSAGSTLVEWGRQQQHDNNYAVDIDDYHRHHASQFKNSAQQHPAVSRQVSSDRFQSDLLADMFADSQGQRQTQTVFCSQSTLPPKSHNAIATALALAAASAAAASYSRREISSTSALLSQPSTNSPHNNRLTPSCLSTIASIALQPIDKKLSRRTCSYCGVLKPTPAALERHIRKHTGERPFVCEICHKAYKAKRSLHCHQLSHHSQMKLARERSGISLLCSVITAAESTGEGVRNISDSETVDQVCSKADSAEHNQMSSLEHSTLPSLPALTVGGHGSHDDDRFCAGPTWDERDDEGREQLSELDQRTCNNCGKVFQRPSDVRRHSLVHTGVRPYVCAICHRGFKQSGSLKFHMKSYHNLDIALSQGLEARFQQSRTRSALRHQSTAGLVVSTQNTPSAGGVQPTLMGAGMQLDEVLLSDGFQRKGEDMQHAALPPAAVTATTMIAASTEASVQQSHVQLISPSSDLAAVTCGQSPAGDHADNRSLSGQHRSGGRVVMVEVPTTCRQWTEGAGRSSSTVAMEVDRETPLFLRLDGRCSSSGQVMMAFCCGLCGKVFASMYDGIIHFRNHCITLPAWTRATGNMLCKESAFNDHVETDHRGVDMKIGPCVVFPRRDCWDSEQLRCTVTSGDGSVGGDVMCPGDDGNDKCMASSMPTCNNTVRQHSSPLPEDRQCATDDIMMTFGHVEQSAIRSVEAYDHHFASLLANVETPRIGCHVHGSFVGLDGGSDGGCKLDGGGDCGARLNVDDISCHCGYFLHHDHLSTTATCQCLAVRGDRLDHLGSVKSLSRNCGLTTCPSFVDVRAAGCNLPSDDGGVSWLVSPKSSMVSLCCESERNCGSSTDMDGIGCETQPVLTSSGFVSGCCAVDHYGNAGSQRGKVDEMDHRQEPECELTPGSVLTSADLVSARAVLMREGIHEDVVVVLPCDPEPDGCMPVPMDAEVGSTCPGMKTVLVSTLLSAVGKKSRRKCSVPTRLHSR